jgi:hypothetical protein
VTAAATAAAVAALAAAAALLQLGVVPAFFLDARGAPLLPAALIAAWASVRKTGETWPALLIAPVMLGAASEERVGWFLLALLPTAALTLIAGRTSAARRFAVAPAAAGAGAVAYLVLLTLAAGRPGALPSATAELAAAALWTAAAAAVATAALWPLRSRKHGLFE